MLNEKIDEFFTADMRKVDNNPSVHPIPKCEPEFIFCIFQGRTGPVQAFVNSGSSNCWLPQDGIPGTACFC